ncbi:protein-L-isoaspartate(D-aspartate) O-methyltransferase [Aliihoeflea aestuarii]|jgi:protein-L-isoaspartate(D-aspartate) O-methyltransferase|uniref:protein-L-isoaspartate(D-aspartate) O-methyltransferase n=1 Tax=Aliihoeflea aestuarii TaxID=453840 RepID=UPI002092C1C8|nr:protein-L-isoaspartate(D-aspartate) O-methyltransferase [Aliihoeflea aestuarii]MCO6390710.1 protein-L-isoaspartate(D-aspartate) O-methyltransferase [Aliihoeflea aestuarii]
MNDSTEREGFAAFLLRARALGITGRELIAAIEATPRQNFVPDQWRDDAWSRRMVPIECGETIEGIDLQAQCLSALGLQSGQRVCEIGTGSGYTAAVMARIAGRVFSLERYKTLAEQALGRLETLGLHNGIVRHADGLADVAIEGPFDRIIAWCSFDALPRHFVDQLSSNGVMVAAIGPAEDEQALARLTKVGSRFEREDIGRVRFQPIVKGVAASI